MSTKKNYDSEFCGSIPLHRINQIQDYGYLIVVDREQLNILQLSENCTTLLGTDLQSSINRPLADFIDPDDFGALSEVLRKNAGTRIPLKLAIRTETIYVPLVGFLHIKSDFVLLEVERSSDSKERSFTEVFQEVKRITSAIEQADTVQQVAEVAIRELRKISGFDGILMYRFDEEWNGTVIAEEKHPALEPYLGQTFPASDIPRQARELYLKNPYRLIPNREYAPVGLFPVLNPLTHSFIDLSDCNLRSVAGVHLEYMKNMKVQASMSIRVVKDDQLWGLISCHHLTAKYLDYEICSVFEWLSTVISTRIAMLLDKDEVAHLAELHSKRTVLVDQVYAANDIVDGMCAEKSSNILGLFNSGGAAVFLDGNIETLGQVPETHALEDLHLWLTGKNVQKVYATNILSEVYDDALAYAKTGSGILVIPIDNDRGDYLVCFRPEVVETINWGGNPDETINFDASGKNYHPRNSFQLWKQEVLNQSAPWSKGELEIAETMRNFLFEFRVKQLYN